VDRALSVVQESIAVRISQICDDFGLRAVMKYSFGAVAVPAKAVKETVMLSDDLKPFSGSSLVATPEK
jgi:hypothetical protein